MKQESTDPSPKRKKCMQHNNVSPFTPNNPGGSRLNNLHILLFFVTLTHRSQRSNHGPQRNLRRIRQSRRGRNVLRSQAKYARGNLDGVIDVFLEILRIGRHAGSSGSHARSTGHAGYARHHSRGTSVGTRSAGHLRRRLRRMRLLLWVKCRSSGGLRWSWRLAGG